MEILGILVILYALFPLILYLLGWLITNMEVIFFIIGAVFIYCWYDSLSNFIKKKKKERKKIIV